MPEHGKLLLAPAYLIKRRGTRVYIIQHHSIIYLPSGNIG